MAIWKDKNLFIFYQCNVFLFKPFSLNCVVIVGFKEIFYTKLKAEIQKKNKKKKLFSRIDSMKHEGKQNIAQLKTFVLFTF